MFTEPLVIGSLCGPGSIWPLHLGGEIHQVTFVTQHDGIKVKLQKFLWNSGNPEDAGHRSIQMPEMSPAEWRTS